MKTVQLIQHLAVTSLLAFGLMTPSQVFAQRAEDSYQSFSYSHQTGERLKNVLIELLPNDDGQTRVILDADGRQLLVRGSSKTLAMAEKILKNLDQPPAQPPANRSVPNEQVRFLDNSVPSQEQQATLVEPSSQRHNGAFRPMSEPERSAPERTPSSRIDSTARNAGQNDSRANQFLRDQRPTIPPVSLDSNAAESTSFFAVRNGLQGFRNRLLAVFGRRLSQFTDRNETVHALRLANGKRVEFTFDARRNGVLVTTAESVMPQLERLFVALDQASQTENRTAVVSIQRSETARLKQAIEAYRGPRRASPAVNDSSQQESGKQTLRQLQSSRSEGLEGTGLALVNYIFQDANATTAPAEGEQPEAAPADDAAVPRAQPGALDVNVEVEMLPDLDVIILEGSNRDVQKLAEIIQELERLSRETQPEIRVVQLNHARSEAISEVVQTVLQDLTGRRQGRVSLTALGKPNAILLIGWGEAIATTVELIRKLDTPVAPETQFQVFRLKHAPVATLQNAIQQFFSSRERLGTRVITQADQRSNSLIVNAAPRDMEEVRKLVESIDVQKSEVVNRARVIEVQNALAADLAETLRSAIAASTGAGSPNAILELLTVDSEGERLIRSGILTDVKITANPRNNTLIVSGPNESLPLIDALIQQMDSPGGVAQIKVFRVMNGDASSLVQMLRSLLPAATGASTGPQLPRVDGETSMVPLRFTVDSRTNSIIATGSDGDLEIIETLLLRLDEKDLAERRNEVYRLKNSPAVDVAIAVNEFLRSERIVSLATPGSGSPFEQIEREVVVVPEPIRNSLIISATPRYFDEIKKLILELDETPAQVMIQVLIAEIRMNNIHEFGVELGIQDSVLFDRGLLGDLLTTTNSTQESTADGVVSLTEQIIQSATNQPGFNFNNNPLGNSGSTQAVRNSDRVGGQGLSHFAVGRVNNELGFGGLVLSASSESVSVLVRALQESRRLDVLSRPQVRTLDNQRAFIQVGQRVPRISAANISDNGVQTNQVELENVGLILQVTPRVSPDGTVVMEIDAEKSSLGPEQEGIPISVSANGNVIRAPRINTTTAQTTVSAASGETIILGGLITKETAVITRSVPYLSQIPLLGDVFRFDSTQNQRSELLIILTPHIIRSREDSEHINQIEMARMSWCAADPFEIHGDLGLSSAPGLADDGVQVIYPAETPRGLPSNAIEPPTPSGFSTPDFDASSFDSPILDTPNYETPILEPPEIDASASESPRASGPNASRPSEIIPLDDFSPRSTQLNPPINQRDRGVRSAAAEIREPPARRPRRSRPHSSWTIIDSPSE